MDLSQLQVLWYILEIAFLAIYLILDGYDLGVGILHLYAKRGLERSVMINSIKPLWDGNEVWLIAFGTCFLGAFPTAYATIFSTFYLPFLLFIFGLVFRAAAIEFRGKVQNLFWKDVWDVLFSLASVIIVVGIGLVVGNLISGLVLNERFDYVGERLLTFFKPYCLALGFTLTLLIAMHGALYLLVKTEGVVQGRARLWFRNSYIVFILAYGAFLSATYLYQPYLVTQMQRTQGTTFALLGAIALLLVLLPFLVARGKYLLGFTSSSLLIVLSVALFAKLFFPMLILNPVAYEQSMTIYNASGSYLGLRNLLIISVIMVPFVVFYTIYVHIVFRGKADVNDLTY